MTAAPTSLIIDPQPPAPAPLPPAPTPAPRWHAAIPPRPLLCLAALLIACGWDRAVWLFVSRHTMPATEAIEAASLRSAIASMFSWQSGDAVGAIQFFGYHAIKSFGTVWFAAAIAACIILRPLLQPDTHRVKIALRRGVLLFLAPAVAGLVAELLKLLFRRQRPEFADGFYSFRFKDFWSASGLGLPSSHAAVAIAAALVLAILWPRHRLIWHALAAACILSRVVSGAHFASDALLGTLVGLTAAQAIIALDRHNNHNTPIPS